MCNFEIFDVADIVEGGTEEEEEEEDHDDEGGKKGRGQDIYLEEYSRYDNLDEFKESEVQKEIKEVMSQKSNRPTAEARKEMYVNKYSQKKSSFKCKRQRITSLFLSTILRERRLRILS